MSAKYPIKKEKRSRSSTDDINNSFVKNVTARMTGLMPASVTKWFGSPSSANANGSAPVAESSDSSTEDEAPEDHITQPLSKKMRYSSPSTSNDYLPKMKSTSTNTESTETFSIVNSAIGRNTCRPETDSVSTPQRSSNDETIPEQKISQYTLQNSYSIIRKRKSLFDITDDERPYKNPQPLNSMQGLSEPQIKRSLLGSPFYAGKTRYGGAAGSYMPNIKHRKTALVSKSANNDSITISHATRRVMDLLENYSSPLIEAKRISQCAKTSKSSDMSLTNNSYKTQELHVPSMAKILRLKQKSRVMDTTSAVRQIIASNSSSMAFTPYPTSKTTRNHPKETSDKLITKMKVNITRDNRNDKTVGVTDESAPVHLPTAVLHIDQNNLPKFTLGTIAVTDTLSDFAKISGVENSANATDTMTTAISATIVNTTHNSATNLMKQDLPTNNKMETISKPQTIINDNPFKFSNPVMIHVGTVQYPLPLPNYTFGSPERRTMEQPEEKDCNKKQKNSKETPSETWKCDDCWVSNESNFYKCVCCGAEKPTKSASKAKHCTVCKVALSQERLDKCIDCENKIDKVIESVPSSIVTSKWKCQDCWVSNDEGVDKCVCCSGKRPQNVTPVANARSDNIASEWKCDVCWIKNKCGADKCAACGGPKTASTQSKTKECISQPQIGIQACSDATFKNIMNSQSEKWECTNCLVQNDKNRGMCVCCDAENLGKMKESEKKSFNFGTITNTTFKFGINNNQNIPEKKAESFPVKQIEMSVKPLETNNNNISEPATFTFGIPKPKPSDKIIAEKETMADNTPKETFTFPLSKPVVSSAPTAASLFSSPANGSSKFPEGTPPRSLIETDEKVQEVPNIEQPNTTVPNNNQKPVGLFGIPLNNCSVATTTPVVITFGQTGQLANSQAVPAVTTTAVDAKVSQSTFSFSGSGNSGLQLFSAVTTASTSTIPFLTIGAPSTSSNSFFQKSEPVHTPSVQLFSKTDPVPSSMSLFNKNETLTTNTTGFSFGSNTQNTQVEKPKFNFSFGATSEIPPVFSLPTSNTGNILSGNSLPSTNTASGNTISGGNGLATGNSTPGSNNLSSNSLASGLIGGPAKKDNIMWPSNNEVGAIKMASGNSIEQGNNNLSVIQSSNPFSLQAKKENTWSLNQNTTLGSLNLPTGNTVDPANNSIGAAPGAMFGTPDKKENVWSMSNNNSNMFAPNVGTNSSQKLATFSFGSSMQFNSNNVTPTPTFGNPTQTQAQNIFGLSGQVNNNQPAMFSSNLQNQAPLNIFGAQAVNNAVSSVGMFGTPNAVATPSFGTPNPSLPTFEAAPLNPVTPTFNFGAQQTTGVFGFGQQQAQSQGGVYKFGAQSATAPQRQFNIGTAGGAANAMSRRPIRRAVRRTSQR